MHIMPVAWLRGIIGQIRRWVWQKVRARAGGDLARADALQVELDSLTRSYQAVIKKETGLSDSAPYNLLGRSELRTGLAVLASWPGATDGLIGAVRRCEAVLDASRPERATSFSELAAEYRSAVESFKAQMTTLRGG